VKGMKIKVIQGEPSGTSLIGKGLNGTQKALGLVKKGIWSFKSQSCQPTF